MDTISFDKLLLKTAFCCMASDGNIDVREIAVIKSMCEKSKLFVNFDFTTEINSLVDRINQNGKDFITYYFELLKKASLTEEEELVLIDFALQTIKADGIIEYSEIKFFKAIRHNLKLSDEKILSVFPDIEIFLEQDIITTTYFENILNNYLDIATFPKFDVISIHDINLGGES